MECLSDIRACYEFVGRERLSIDVGRIVELPMDQANPSCRAFLYAILEMTRGKVKRALGFIRQAREHAADIEELTYVLYVEGVLLSLEGDYQQAIARQTRCAEVCRLTGDKRLESDALLYLSNIYLKLGEPAIAKVYEKEAALTMPRRRRDT
jgi:tetratricopeptide (TPR) repeat protein